MSPYKEYNIYSVRVIGNFWTGSIYEKSVDSIFVFAKSPLEAKLIADKSRKAITNMFKEKMLFKSKKRAIRLRDNKLVKISYNEATAMNRKHGRKVLIDSSRFISLDLK